MMKDLTPRRQDLDPIEIASRDEIEALEQMAQELLDLSMIESGRAEIRLIPVELGEIIRTAVSRFSEQAERKSLRWE